jgi:predicted nucleotidyltransferase
LNREQIEAIRDVRDSFPGVDVLLIGAFGLGHHIDLGYRATNDVDLAVAVELDEFPGALTTRLARTEDRYEHRFTTEQDVSLDILPAGPTLRADGKLRLPSGTEMSLVGFDVAFEHYAPVSLAPDLSVGIPPACVFVVLKAIAWLDRPYERLQDAQDPAYLLSLHLPPRR